jgi:hypothetical protein
LKLGGSKGHALAAVPPSRALTSIAKLEFFGDAEDLDNLQGVAAALEAAATSMGQLTSLNINLRGQQQW